MVNNHSFASNSNNSVLYFASKINCEFYFRSSKCNPESITASVFISTFILGRTCSPRCRDSMNSPGLFLLLNEQLQWNKWRISALLNSNITVIARGGDVIPSPSLSSWFQALHHELRCANTHIHWLKPFVVVYKT